MARNKDLDVLKERALVNFELLLNLWDVDYQQIGANEYDFLSPTRSDDKSFGACRFNVSKGIGSDFAGISYSKEEFERVGIGFSKEDFAGFSQYGESNPNFDIVGLTQRIHHLDTYNQAAKFLKEELDKIDGGKVDLNQLLVQSSIRHEQAKIKKEKMRSIAERIWKYCQDVNGTIGETYLQSRKILIAGTREPAMKFHYKVFNNELNMYIPALIFKVSHSPESQLEAIHRIWIAADGTRKARLKENKKAVGSISGNGIWLGEPDETLYVCEGPEEALSVKYEFEKKFVVSTVYATNFSNLTIPSYVKKVVLIPDDDSAGEAALQKATKAYLAKDRLVKVKKRAHNG